jgi:hypothetical protein
MCHLLNILKFANRVATFCEIGEIYPILSYFLNSIVLSIPLKSNTPLKNSEELLHINNHRKNKFITLPISLLFSFTIHSDMTSCNVLPICLMQLSVI